VASTGSPVSQAVDERQLVTQLRQLLAVSERYPDLKANEQFGKLMAQLGETEDRIQAARRFYNGNVRDFNNRVESFPSNLVARVFGFAAEEFFQIEEVVQRQAPAVVL
jgi:LemA protein